MRTATGLAPYDTLTYNRPRPITPHRPYNWPYSISTPPYNWPHPQPLSKRRGEWYAFKTNVVRRMRTATGLTPYDTLTYNRPRPILHTVLQLAFPPTPTGLTPSPSPRGEGSGMLLKRTLLGASLP